MTDCTSSNNDSNNTKTQANSLKNHPIPPPPSPAPKITAPKPEKPDANKWEQYQELEIYLYSLLENNIPESFLSGAIKYLVGSKPWNSGRFVGALRPHTKNDSVPVWNTIQEKILNSSPKCRAGFDALSRAKDVLVQTARTQASLAQQQVSKYLTSYLCKWYLAFPRSIMHQRPSFALVAWNFAVIVSLQLPLNSFDHPAPFELPKAPGLQFCLQMPLSSCLRHSFAIYAPFELPAALVCGLYHFQAPRVRFCLADTPFELLLLSFAVDTPFELPKALVCGLYPSRSARCPRLPFMPLSSRFYLADAFRAAQGLPLMIALSKSIGFLQSFRFPQENPDV